MNLEHVKSYLALLRTRSCHKAANQLGLSQLTVSRHIRKVQGMVGTEEEGSERMSSSLF